MKTKPPFSGRAIGDRAAAGMVPPFHKTGDDIKRYRSFTTRAPDLYCVIEQLDGLAVVVGERLPLAAARDLQQTKTYQANQASPDWLDRPFYTINREQ
jgi:hypothetical protein